MKKSELRKKLDRAEIGLENLKKANTDLNAKCEKLSALLYQSSLNNQRLNQVVVDLAFELTANKNIIRAAQQVNNSWTQLTLEGPVTDALKNLRKVFQKPVSEREEEKLKRREKDAALNILSIVHGKQ